jgi:prepilin-type N-terminal cleavage/methylation domain-containing protein
MRQGFTLIEIIIAIAISSLVSAILFFSFNQIQKSTKIIEQMLSIDPAIMTIANQFEKDISGSFVPKFWHLVPESAPKAGLQVGVALGDNKKINGDISASFDNQKKEEYQKIEKVFFSTNQGDNLKELTFITCNPLQVYKNYKPRIVRVLYRLVQDEENKNSYRLLRKESLSLDFGKFDLEKNIEYEVGSNIKSFSVSYIFPEKAKEDLKDQKEEEIKYKTVHVWEKESEKKDSEFPDIPQFILLKIVLWDIYFEDEYSFEIRYQIFAFEKDEKQEKKEVSKRVPQQQIDASSGAQRAGLGSLIR